MQHICLFTIIKKVLKFWDAVTYYFYDKQSVNSRKCCESPGPQCVTHYTGTDPVHEQAVCNLPNVRQQTNQMNLKSRMTLFNNVFI